MITLLIKTERKIEFLGLMKMKNLFQHFKIQIGNFSLVKVQAKS